MRFRTAVVLMFLTAPAAAQGIPGMAGLTPEQMKAIPPDVLAKITPDMLAKIPLSTLSKLPPDLFKSITPDMLAKIPPNVTSMSPDDVKAYVKGMDKGQRDALKSQALALKAQIDTVPGLWDQLKAIAKSMMGK